ncbi:ATP-dependent DNA helicase RecG [Porticoccus sp.]|uniref:ATP-dependent DNA helicase RecG n=1 Tax=Porticoccus sp. TaxID=2024853 RepID=UPI003F69957C
MNKIVLDQLPVTRLKGVGTQLSLKLAKLLIHSIQDLLFHLPVRYLDRTRVTPIGALQPNRDVVIEGEIRGCDLAFGRRRSLICRVQDHTGIITLRFFHFSTAQRQNLARGGRLRCFGEVRAGSSGIEMYHPEYQFLDGDQALPLQQHLTAVYPVAEGVSQQRLRTIIDQALALVSDRSLTEFLEQDNAAPSLADAIKFLHQPPTDAPLDLLARGEHPAQQRLAYEEMLAHQLSLLRLRQAIRQHQAPELKGDDKVLLEFLASLPFPLTNAQQRVSQEIKQDLEQTSPMLRLLQGDVGSGKTVVSAMAALQCVASGRQVALMAPTEILAEQHRNNFTQWLEPLGIQIAWLTGKVKGKARERQLAMIDSGSAQIAIGTHALFQEQVQFHNLGLIIIDEQHRFGVHQRLALRNKGQNGQIPHQLVMTATPIPRTLAMSAYADLDCSIIDELPPGRAPVSTVVISNQRRLEVVERVRNACAQGRQSYWVCTLIEESELLEAEAAEATADALHLLLPQLPIGLIHGRLKPAEKAATMSAFKAGDIQLLVATTVIEVGVDVPNASLMVIENPERLGLAQLHQLRGRVGRGQTESYCVLLYSPPLSAAGSQRLSIMRQTNDGFQIAEKDLQLRGPGEMLGTRQTGDVMLRIADLQRDSHLLPEIRCTAQQMLSKNPDRVSAIIRRWLGETDHFSQV